MQSATNKYRSWLWTATTFLVIIGVAIVVRRLLFLNDLRHTGSYVPVVTESRSPVPDAGFAQHPTLTLIHIVPGLLFMLLAPLQFLKRVKEKYPRFRRITWYIIFFSGLVIGITALIMGFTMAIGGITETLAVAVYGVLFLFSLLKAFLYLIDRNPALHREWMIRALAIGLAVSTTRPIVALFFATSRFTGLTVQQYFGLSFWIAFTLHIIVAEIWIHKTRGIETRVSIPSGQKCI
jgi:hypothetical protein